MSKAHQRDAAHDLMWHIVAAGSSVMETTLHEARVTVLTPSRIVVVGDGQRVRIDRDGTSRQTLRQVRLDLPMSSEVTADPELERTLAQWAGRAAILHARDVVRSREGFARCLQLTARDGTHARLCQGSGRDVSA